MKQVQTKGKVGFVVPNAIFFRHYILTGALRLVGEQHDLVIFAEEHLRPLFSKNPTNHTVFYYRYSKKIERKIRLINELSLFASKDLSRDFSFRIARKYNSSADLRDGSVGGNPIKSRIKTWLKKNLYRLICKEIIVSKLCKSCQLLLEAGSPIRDENRKRHFDVIICPSNAGGTADTDISGLSHQDTDTKTLILIDNWDNFSSKYVMPFHPDKVVVWGEQTKLHAITLQGLRENSIRVMGTPRFSEYYSKKANVVAAQSPKASLPKHYLLVIGSQTFWDENSFLIRLQEVVDKEFDGLPIVYRPHPWRETFGQKFLPPAGILVDPTLGESGANSEMHLPSLDLYKQLLTQATLIIGGCTSMIVEAGILRKKFLLLAHDDNNPIQSPFEYFRRAEHQNLTFALEHVEICYHLDSLSEKIKLLMSKEITASDPVLEQIISSKSQNYSVELSDLVNQLCFD